MAAVKGAQNEPKNPNNRDPTGGQRNNNQNASNNGLRPQKAKQ